MRTESTQDKKAGKGVRYKIIPVGITTRVAIFLILMVFIPMILTGVAIEKALLLPGENMYLAIPVFFLPLIIPFSRLIAHYLINKDLLLIQEFCSQIKQGNFNCFFELPNQKEEEDALILLLRNLTWMSHSLEFQNSMSRNRFSRMRNDLGKVQQQAFSDALTGLYNRRFLENFINNCRGVLPYEFMSMIFIDCDKFKQVNDTMGHTAGDNLLIWLANCLKKACRGDTDIPLRLGGDEFAMLVMDTDANGASTIGMRIQALYHRRDSCQTSLSIGIASTSCREAINMETIERLYEAADKQVYEAKKAGGNRIAVEGRFIRQSNIGENNANQ